MIHDDDRDPAPIRPVPWWVALIVFAVLFVAVCGLAYLTRGVQT